MRTWILVVVVILVASGSGSSQAPASRQTPTAKATGVLPQAAPDPCQTVAPGSTFTVTSGAPFWIGWTLPPSDPNGLPNRVNGFYIQIDGAAKSDIGMATQAAMCANGTGQAGKIPFTYQTTSGVARGSHQLTMTAWNFVLDANGQQTTARQESAPVSVPFVAADQVMAGPPVGLGNIWIGR